MLRNNDFIRALQNSVIVSVGTVAISLLIGSFAAYALGRMQFRGRTAVLYIVLSMTMFPSVAILGSLFLMIRGDWFLPTPNLYNTRIALVITYLIFTLPFTVWVMTQFFKAMPGELEEAALVDGAGPMRVFWQILLPLALPGLVTTGLLAFIAAWNEFLFALTFTTDYDARTVQVAISQFSGGSSRSCLREPHGGLGARHLAAHRPGPHLPAQDPGWSHRRRGQRLGAVLGDGSLRSW